MANTATEISNLAYSQEADETRWTLIQIHQNPEKDRALLETLPKVNQRFVPLHRISGLHPGCRYV